MLHLERLVKCRWKDQRIFCSAIKNLNEFVRFVIARTVGRNSSTKNCSHCRNVSPLMHPYAVQGAWHSVRASWTNSFYKSFCANVRNGGINKLANCGCKFSSFCPSTLSTCVLTCCRRNFVYTFRQSLCTIVIVFPQ